MKYSEFLAQMRLYDKIGSGDSDLKEIMTKKKEKEVLDFIRTFHDRAVSHLTSGRYAGSWQTYIGNGRTGRRVIRTKELEEMLTVLAEHYGIKTPETVKKLTLTAYFDHWLDWKADRNGNKDLTVRHNRNCFEKHVQGTPLAKIPIPKITTEDLDTWARSVLKETPLSAKRFNTLKITVTGPLELAVREGIISESPWKRELLDYRRLLKSERRAPSYKKIFYPDEIERIVKRCWEDYEKSRNVSNLAVIFNFDMGLRVGELAALRWDDIDWRRKTISIRRQESEGKVEEYVKSDSAAGYRELPLNDRLISLLKRFQRDSGVLSGFVFTDAQGRRKTVSAIQKRLIYVQVGKGGDGAGSEVKRIHCQRRTVGTMIAKERGLEAARQWLGHTDLQTTLRYIYTMETVDSLRAFSEETSALKVLDDIKKAAPAKVTPVAVSVV